MKQTTIAIIGVGNVGATTAFALMLQDVAAEILLVDVDENRCRGELYDLADVLPFSKTAQIRVATSREAAQADIIIIAAGKKQEPGQERSALAHTNAKIVEAVITTLVPINPQAMILVITNPVDTMTHVVQRVSGLSHSQVFGTGTFLDTQRLRGYIARTLAIAENSVDAYVIGEHGPTQVVAWSSADIAGQPLNNFPVLTQAMREQISQQTRDKAAHIIACKGSTYFGIAACAATLCSYIVYNKKQVAIVSCWQEQYQTYFSMPAVIGKNGIEDIIPITLNTEEQNKLTKSAQTVQNQLVSIVL